MANLKFYKEIAELLDIDPSKMASDDSSFVTGIELFVDGGSRPDLTARRP